MKPLQRFLLMAALPFAATAAFATAPNSGAVAADKTIPASSIAIFASGCFWCTEADFEKIPGVNKVESGYIGGHLANPTYEQVSAGNTGHTEAVRVVYDPSKVSYAQLLDAFWRNVDPTVKDAQFCDVGNQYRSGIYYFDDVQRRAAESSKQALLKSRKFPSIFTEIELAKKFYVAEQYHQDYYKKNPLRYRYYRHGCGRDARLEVLWGPKPK
jgi:peptide-methionine (S)-S-oxide reductase